MKSKDELVILGSPIGESGRKELTNEKRAEQEKISEVIDKLEAHGFSTPRQLLLQAETLIFFCVQVQIWFAKLFFRKIDRILRNSLCKVTNVTLNDSHFLQAVLPVAKGSLGVSSARLIALTACLASTVGSKAVLIGLFGLKREDALEL